MGRARGSHTPVPNASIVSTAPILQRQRLPAIGATSMNSKDCWNGLDMCAPPISMVLSVDSSVVTYIPQCLGSHVSHVYRSGLIVQNAMKLYPCAVSSSSVGSRVSQGITPQYSAISIRTGLCFFPYKTTLVYCKIGRAHV